MSNNKAGEGIHHMSATRLYYGDGPRKPRNRHEYQAERYRRRKEAKSDAV